MSSSSMASIGAVDRRCVDDASDRRNVLNPSNNGVGERLVNGIANGRTSVAVAIAIVSSYVALGIVITGLGLLLTHVLEHGSIGVWDHHVSLWFDRRRTRGWDRITGDVTDIADTIEVAAVAAVVTIFLLIRRWGRRAFLLLVGLVIELSVFLSANAIVARPRPAVSHLGGTPSTFSFPSGHTAASVVLYGGIAIIVAVATKRRWPGFLLFILAVVVTACVGLSRVYRGEHYPTDVLGGLLLGIGALSAAVFTIRVTQGNDHSSSETSRQRTLGDGTRASHEVAT